MNDTPADTSGGATVVDGTLLEGGAHCETTALQVLLSHAGVHLSEPMLFGLGEGLSFVYWDSKNQDVPFLGGRVKPFELTRNLTERLGAALHVQETTSDRKAWDQVRQSLDAGVPVGLQLDSYHLEYFSSRVHFAGHVVAMYGYDDMQAYLVDTAQQGGAVRTSLESLARARAERGPMSARHRSFTLGPADASAIGARIDEVIVPAITACATAFLRPPIANLGHRGIRTAARRASTWFDRVTDPGRDLPMMAMMMERAGTGGALFRNLYRDFLAESADRLVDPTSADIVRRGRDLFAESAELWTTAAHVLDSTGTGRDSEGLAQFSDTLVRIADIETDAMTVLRTLDDA